MHMVADVIRTFSGSRMCTRTEIYLRSYTTSNIMSVSRFSPSNTQFDPLEYPVTTPRHARQTRTAQWNALYRKYLKLYVTKRSELIETKKSDIWSQLKNELAFLV